MRAGGHTGRSKARRSVRPGATVLEVTSTAPPSRRARRAPEDRSREANGPSVELPSKTIFSAGAGGELECGAAGKGATTGSLKIMGYEESELITVKNP